MAAILDNFTQAVLQLTWKNGDNTEDKQLITEEYFQDIARLVQDAPEENINLLAFKLYHKGYLTDKDRESFDYANAEQLYPECRKSALEYIRNDLIKKANFYTEKGKLEDAAKLLERVQEVNAAIQNPSQARAKTNLASNYLKNLERKKNSPNPSWGFPDLDKYTGGIERTRLYIVAGRPSNGKSVFGLNTVINTYTKGNKVLYFTLEEPVNEVLTHLILYTGLIEPEEARTGNISEVKRAAIEDFLTRLERDNTLKIYDDVRSLEEIKSVIHKEKPFLVVIDQLSFIRPIGSYINKRDQYGEVTRELKTCAIKEDAAIVLLCQMNRENTAGTSKSLERLAEADAIGQDADGVMLLELVNDKKEMRLDLVKNRCGKTAQDEDHIGLTFIGSKYQLKNKAFPNFTQTTTPIKSKRR